MKPEINIVWFKRDLRFTDHAPLYFAQQDAVPILLLYCFEHSSPALVLMLTIIEVHPITRTPRLGL